MRKLLTLALLILCAATPSFAAERVLLTPLAEGKSLAAASPMPGGLAALRQQAQKSGSVRVIIGLRVPFAAEGLLSPDEQTLQRLQIKQAALRFRSAHLAELGGDTGAIRSYETLPFAALTVTAKQLEELANDPSVISINPDRVGQRTLAESAPLIGAPTAWKSGFTGLGQTVAVIDDGIDKNHPFVAGKVVGEACFSSIMKDCPGKKASSTAAGSGAPCKEGCKHGMHVAGIVAGRNQTMSGIAPEAKLISIRVFAGPKGVLFAESDAIAGLDHVYTLRDKFKIASVNMSLASFDSYFGPCDVSYPAYTAAIANLRSAGIASVAASGNDGFSDIMGSPACVTGAISVGATTDSPKADCSKLTPPQADRVACFSNGSENLSLLAPGTAITSSLPQGKYGEMSGTSMATPHVSGAWAVLKQKMPDASVDDILAALQSTGSLITDYRPPYIVKPRINLAAALDALPVTLSFTRLGNGKGAVTFTEPSGSTACSADCFQHYKLGTLVTLTAKPANKRSRFTGWSGACSGTGSCTLTMSAAQTVSATFKR